MRMKLPFFVGALSLVSATPAAACNFWFAATGMPIVRSLTWGVGTAIELGDYTYFSPTADASLPLGDKGVIRPAIGVCSGEGSTDPFFGAGFAWQLSKNDKMSINLQSGINYLTFDGGSEMTIPIGAAANFTSNSNMSFYAGASLWWKSVDIDGLGSASDSDPVLFGGVNGKAGTMGWTAGAVLQMGEGGSDFALVAGLSLNKAASAIRHIPSLFRK